jgi:hypothetical protein
MLSKSEIYALFEQCNTGQLSIKSIDPVQATLMRNKESRSLLTAVILSGHRELIKDYFSHVGVSTEDEVRRAMTCAAHTGDAELFQEVYGLTKAAWEGMCKDKGYCKDIWGPICASTLEDACSYGYADIARILINHDVCSTYYFGLQAAWSQGHLDVVDMMIDAGVRSHEDSTGLFIMEVLRQSHALLGNSMDVETRGKLINHLINRGAGTGAVEDDENLNPMPIMPTWAGVGQYGTEDIARHAVNVGLITAEDIEGALEYSCRGNNQETFRYLLTLAMERQYAVDMDMLFDTALEHDSGEIAEQILEGYSVHLSWADMNKRNLRMKFVLAAKCGSVAVVEKLLKKVGGDVNCVAEHRTEFSIVAPCTALSRASDPATIRFLLDAKADVNSEGCDTVLRGACQKLRPDAVKMLLAAGADVTDNMSAASALYAAVYATLRSCVCHSTQLCMPLYAAVYATLRSCVCRVHQRPC